MSPLLYSAFRAHLLICRLSSLSSFAHCSSLGGRLVTTVAARTMVARTTTLSNLVKQSPVAEVQLPPLALPALPVRTASSSTSSSTAYSARSFPRTANSSQSTLPSSGLEPSPKLTSSPMTAKRPTIGARSSTSGSGTSGSSSKSVAASAYDGLASDGEERKQDDLDRLGYVYSLRVAALAQRLTSAPAPSSPGPVSSPLLPPPVITTGSRSPASPMSFSSFRTPDPQEDKVPLPMRRKKSIGYLRLGRKDELKLPREFIIEFWGILGAEEGDANWHQAVRGFLALVQKKGYKTSSGSSMREIPVLIETFTSCLPHVNLNSSPIHSHQAHLLKLLYDALPTSAHFAASTSDKDKDLLFRLRAEVQMHMVDPKSPSRSEFSPQLMAQASQAKANIANGLGLNPPSPISPTTPVSPLPVTPRTPHMTHSPSSRSLSDTVKRKPSPIWTGDGNLLGNLIEAVGLIWGVSRSVLEKDFDEVQRSNLEKLYLEDLKRSLSELSRRQDPCDRARHAQLSKQLTELLSTFPYLALPTSPVSYGHDDTSFFIPARKAAVFGRLSERVQRNSSSRSRELLKRCQETWNEESRVDRERRVEDAFRAWNASIGTEREVGTGQQLASALACLAPLVTTSGVLPSPLDDVFSRLKKLLASAASAIYSAGDIPERPAPSLIPLFQAAPALFIRSPIARRALDDIADDLKGGAVQAYVTAAGDTIGSVHDAGQRHSRRDAVIEGFERLAEWIENEVRKVANAWGNGLDSAFNPAAIIIGRQLPLFLAELQVLEGVNGASSDVFSLYEVTWRLSSLWDKLCPGVSHGFDVDAFFEPHVIMWLRETEANETHQWVTRAVGMDQWVPEGDLRHSQSVPDLFDLIRGATQTIRDLPLSDYKRAVFLADLSRTASAALSQYATTVHGLFQADMQVTPEQTAPAPSMGGMGGKASAWLAKGKHTVHKLDQRLDHRLDRKRIVFMVPAHACVKLSNMGAAVKCLDGLEEFLEAEDTSHTLSKHNLNASNRLERQLFTVTVLRGQNLLTRASAKPADAFVAVKDCETGARVFKSRTVLETEDPRWEQGFEVSLSQTKTLELECLDRQLVGKHDTIGSRTFTIDPAAFENVTERDVILTLKPRGVIHLRISTQGRERHDVDHHLKSAARVLERTASDMTRDIVDSVCAYVRAQLSVYALAMVVKPLKDKKRGRIALSDEEVDASISPVFTYLDETFSIFAATLTDEVRTSVTLAIWERIVDNLISLLIPPLSSKPYTRTPLSPPEVDVVFKWLQSLKSFFIADGQGIPSSSLSSGTYRDMLLLGQCLDLPTQTLKERAAAAVRASSGSGVNLRGGLSASRARVNEDNERVAEVLLRIVRMRSGTGEFLETQLAALVAAKAG